MIDPGGGQDPRRSAGEVPGHIGPALQSGGSTGRWTSEARSRRLTRKHACGSALELVFRGEGRGDGPGREVAEGLGWASRTIAAPLGIRPGGSGVGHELSRQAPRPGCPDIASPCAQPRGKEPRPPFPAASPLALADSCARSSVACPARGKWHCGADSRAPQCSPRLGERQEEMPDKEKGARNTRAATVEGETPLAERHRVAALQRKERVRGPGRGRTKEPRQGDKN